MTTCKAYGCSAVWSSSNGGQLHRQLEPPWFEPFFKIERFITIVWMLSY
jgi:hypothetical protein